jgi:hypothetical protein
LEAIEGIGPKTVEKISLAVNNYFSGLEGAEVAAEGEAAIEEAPIEEAAAEEESAGEEQPEAVADQEEGAPESQTAADESNKESGEQ